MNSGGSFMSLNQNMMIFRYFQMFFVVTLPCHKACCVIVQGFNKQVKDIILIAKRALKKPTGWERVDLKVLRRCQLRIYGALSAAVCATQTRHEMYSGWLFEKVLWDETMVEPWESWSWI